MCALLATTAAACSSSKHTGGASAGATTVAGGGTGTNGTGTNGTGSSGNGTGTGSNGASNGTGSGTGSGNGSGNGSGTTRPTSPTPTTSAPSTPEWLKAHRSDLTALKAAVGAVNVAFQANDATAKTLSLVACANAAAPLARSAAGSLPAAQADAIITISDGCAQMAHDLKSGDIAAVDSGKTAFDKALVIVTPLFP